MVLALLVFITRTNTESTQIPVDLGVGTTSSQVKVPTILPIKSAGPRTVTVGNKTLPTPSLTALMIISDTLSPEVQKILRNKEAEVIAQLKATPNRSDLWLDLGIYRKIAMDYKGAEEVWSYIAVAGSVETNYIAYGNLGDLYMNFLKNYPKAESSYKSAIALKPDVIDYYRNLYTLYRYAYKTDTTSASDILTQGLKANPSNPDLLQLQSQLQSQL